MINAEQAAHGIVRCYQDDGKWLLCGWSVESGRKWTGRHSAAGENNR